jgi:hypothetical protein
MSMLKRVAWTAVLLAALYGSVLFTMLSPAAPPPIESPLVPESSGWTPQPVRLRQDSSGPDEVTYRLRVSMTSPEELLKHEEIRLLVATYRTRPHLAGARLQLLGTPCSYETPPTAKLLDNQQLPFARGSGCQSVAASGAGDLELSVRLGWPGKVAVWTFTPPTGAADLHSIVVSPAEPGVGTPRPILRGSYVDYPPPSSASRAELLSYMWQLSPKLGWLWLSVAVSFCLAFAGSLIFPMHHPPGTDGGPRLRFVMAGGFGASCLATALGLLYAVLTPPLMGPDEPYHLLGFAALNDNRRIPPETDNWIHLMHLNRIRFHGDQHFRPKDVSRPWPESDPFLGATEVQARSGASTAYWRVLGRLLQNQSAANTLIGLRLANVLLFGVAVGAATALGMLCTSVPYPQLLCLVFLFVPTLPFFAMHVSDYVTLCAAYVLLAGSLLVLFLDGPRSHWTGLPLGLAIAVMLSGNRSSLPLLAVVALVLLTRIVLSTRDAERKGTASWIFWLGFGLGASVFFALVKRAHLPAMFAEISRSGAQGVPAAVEWYVGNPWALGCLVAVGVLGEAAFRLVRSRMAEPLVSCVARIASVAVAGLAAAVVLSMLGSLVFAFPHVLMIQPPNLPVLVANPPSPRAYAAQVLVTGLTFFRLKEPDLYLVWSFLGGFGWFDTVPPPVFLTGLVVLIGVSSVALSLYLVRARDHRRITWLFAVFLGCGVSLVLYALSCYSIPVNLHGRYLIGWYLCWLSLALSAPAVLPSVRQASHAEPGAAHSLLPRVAVLLVLCGVIHVYCLSFILRRYF